MEKLNYDKWITSDNYFIIERNGNIASNAVTLEEKYYFRKQKGIFV